MSRMMMMVRVRLAFFCVGSRKALTPFETASTPVMAVHPLAKTLARTQRVSIDALTGRCGGSTTGTGRPPAAKARTAPTMITISSVPTEVGWEKKSGPCVLDSARVDQGEDQQDGEAERERVGLEPGEC